MRRLFGYPCTPTKTVCLLARQYYFCGFCYPIREGIPIAIYRCNISTVSLGKGKLAAAAYRNGEKLTNEWDGMTHGYTRKRGVAHTEILLPPHSQPSFSDRATLWNSVELYENAGNAELAREIDAALSIGLSREEQILLVWEYCSSKLFQEECALILPFTTPTAATPIVKSCLPLTVKEAAQPDIVKKIGNATYRVKIHFSTASKETTGDNINRIIMNDCGKMS